MQVETTARRCASAVLFGAAGTCLVLSWLGFMLTMVFFRPASIF